MKFNVKTLIKSSCVQSNGYIRFPHLVRIFQDSAFQHSDYLGLTQDILLKSGVSWVLYSMYVKVYNYPKLNDSLEITTWVSNKQKILINRDYHVINDNTHILDATTCWALFNLDKRQAMFIPDNIYYIYEPEYENILAGEGNNFPFHDNINYNYTYEFTVRHMDLDSNDHVNNITYIDFIYTAIYRILKKPVYIKTLNIVYKKEITIDIEKIKIQLNNNSEQFNFKIINDNILYSYGFLQLYK
jgi:medium-chain acyl-[acyl-carrier-protein] hydrolase